jgi:hypothetical protein
MGVRIICTHGYYVDGCRCMQKHAVRKVPCPWEGEHAERVTYLVKPEQVTNPEVLPSPESSTVVDRMREGQA